MFTMNGKTYKTDEATLEVLRSIIKAAHATNDYSAVVAVMALGQKTCRIVEM